MKPPYDRTAHQVTIQKDTPLYHILKKEQMGVNSYHHQAVKTLSPDFQKTAISEDGLIEGIYMPSRKFIMGVQWHPEFSYEVDDKQQENHPCFCKVNLINNEQKERTSDGY